MDIMEEAAAAAIICRAQTERCCVWRAPTGQRITLPAAILAYVGLHPEGVRCEEIFEHLYGDSPDGGPLFCRSVIIGTISRLNQDQLQPRDLIISRQRRRSPMSHYNLRRISTGNIWLPLWRKRE